MKTLFIFHEIFAFHTSDLRIFCFDFPTHFTPPTVTQPLLAGKKSRNMLGFRGHLEGQSAGKWTQFQMETLNGDQN